MKKSILILVLLLPVSSLGQTFRIQKFCEVGGQTVTTQGLVSKTHVQRSFPSCTVTVYLTGTVTPATIFSDSINTPLANPFTANVDGSFGLYAATTSCYDIVTSGGNTGDQFPTPFTYSNVCIGSGGGGGGGGVNPGTPFQVTRYNSAGTNIQDSTGSDNPANGPTQWPSGLSVENNAGYRKFVNSPNGTTTNLLICADPTVTSMTQATTCPTSTGNARGIADIGAGTTGNVKVAMIGYHACIFDNQTVVEDYFGPSTIVAGECSDLGPSKPSNVEVMGHVNSLNSGASTLATVDLFTGDTIAPGSSGSGGTVVPCGGAYCDAYYPTASTTIINGDQLATDDGVGNKKAKSLGLTDTTHAGFWFETQGATPPPAPPNSTEFYMPTTITTPNSFQLPLAAGGGDVGKFWGVTSSTTDTNGNPVDVMTLVSPTCPGGSDTQLLFNDSGSCNGATGLTWNKNTNTFKLTDGSTYTTAASTTALSYPTNWGWVIGSGGADGALKLQSGTTQAAAIQATNTSTTGGVIKAQVQSFTGMGHTFSNGGSFLFDPTASLGIGIEPSNGLSYHTSIQDNNLTASNPIYADANKILQSGTYQGNTHAFQMAGTVSGTAAPLCTDANGNDTTVGCPAASSGNFFYCANDATGTVLNEIAKCTTSGCSGSGNACEVISANEPPTASVAGVVISGAGTSGFAQIQTSGPASCIFDTGPTKGDVISYQTSPGQNGKCHDYNGGPPNIGIAPGIGIAETTNGGGGTYTVDLGYSGGPTGRWFLPLHGAGSQFGMSSSLFQFAPNGPSNSVGEDVYLVATSHLGFNLNYNGPSSDYIGQSVANFIDIHGDHGEVFNAAHVLQTQTTGNTICTNNGAYIFLTLNNDQTIGNNGGCGSPQEGQLYFMHFCQGASTQGRATFSGDWQNPPIVPAFASGCVDWTMQLAGANLWYLPAPASPIHVVQTGQTAAISDTALTHPMANTLIRINAVVNCITTSAAATATLNMKYTDTSSTVQTVSVTDTCTSLTTSGVPNITATARVKADTDVTYGVTIANTPTYDVDVSVQAAQ